MFKHLVYPLLVVLALSCALRAQVSVEAKQSGLQFNLTTLGYYQELGLNERFTLRSQIDAQLRWHLHAVGENHDVYVRVQPTVRLEPRYYYNLSLRDQKGKSTTNNSGNFIGIKTAYRLPFQLIGTKGIEPPRGRVSIIPRWGIRRDLGHNWDFELGLGAGINATRHRGSHTRMHVIGVLDVEWKFGVRF